ncbi:MAG TPA: penicillin-binding protein 2 [Thermoanaerobaculia bacterium]|nr:penicillin-binding protein 2 [Thermoanaerobaculia bacterium]
MKVVREHREDLVQRVRLMSRLVTVVLVLIGAGFWFVQMVQGDYYRELAENNRLRKLPIAAPRGLIFDRHGRLLVENIPSYNLMIDRSRSGDVKKALDFVADVLGKPRDDLQALLQRYRGVPVFKPVLVGENLTLAQVSRIGAFGLEFPEFEVEVQHLRLYRHGGQTAHILGYLGEVTAEEVESSEGALTPGDPVGKKGMEKTYDARLRGKDGERVVVVDSRGELLREYGQQPAVPGKNLTLTLDLDLQQEAARLLDGPEKVGAIVALDPRNGEILALVSSPSFNSNLFARRLAVDEWQALLDAPNNPLQDRALQNAYSPGSTFKIIMATAGLTEHVISEHDSVFCPGSTVIYGHPFRCWRKEGHGTVDVHEALAHSCDVFFYHLGQKLGIERIAKYARLFGLGSPTGIDLQGEKRGLVPDPAWSLKYRKIPWYPGETISVAIGQGPVLLTPLQMAMMTAIVANGGKKVVPHLLKDDPDLPEPERVALDPKALDAVRRGLWAVVNEPGGTAYNSVRVPNMDIAGKTGSVQVIAQAQRTKNESLPFKYRDHGWFTSFAPLSDPRIVLVVFAEHGGGSHGAMPLAHELYEKYFATDLDPSHVL